jgi:hypothetical protein
MNHGKRPARSLSSSFLVGFGKEREHLGNALVARRYPSPERVLSMPDRSEFIKKIRLAARSAKQ